MKNNCKIGIDRKIKMDINNVMKNTNENQEAKKPIVYNGVCVHVDTFRGLQSLRLRYKTLGHIYTNGTLIDMMVNHFSKQVSKIEQQAKAKLQ